MAAYATEMLHRLERMAVGMTDSEHYYFELQSTTGLVMDVTALIQARKRLLDSLSTYEDYLEQTLPHGWMDTLRPDLARLRADLEEGARRLKVTGSPFPEPEPEPDPEPAAPAPTTARPKWPAQHHPTPAEVAAHQTMLWDIMEMANESARRRAHRREEIQERIARLRYESL